MMCRLGLVFCFIAFSTAGATTLTSPDGRLSAILDLSPTGALVYSLQRGGTTLIEPSLIGVTVDGKNLGVDLEIGKPAIGTVTESYPVLGGKSLARIQANTLTLPLHGKQDGAECSLEARIFNDGFAWRMVIPGTGLRRISGESSSWTLPAESRVWFYERNSDWKLKSYAGVCSVTDIEKLPTISQQGPVQCPPLVAELSRGGGYVVITEAALSNYSGMRLRAIGRNQVEADFTEGKKGFEVEGTITTPWRVTLAAENLNQLVNSDVISSLNAAPDPVLFSNRDYIRPGRTVWRWWSLGTGTPTQERQMIDQAVELGFEYTLVDDGWKKWPDAWKQIAGLSAYGRKSSVGVFIWEDSNSLNNPADNFAQLRAFLNAAQSSGVAGIKLDFFNSESKTSVDFQRTILRFAAERRLMVSFHGVQKPTGESRTFPNEITREGIRGLELNKMSEGPIPPSHNAALPFTRYLAGAGDYTPLGYSNPGKTTWAQQLATVIQGNSPQLVIAENPDQLLHNPATQPALDVLKAIPSVWDETRVLEPSKIGDLAVIARRKGKDWFLAILNGEATVKLSSVDLSFLGKTSYNAVVLSSPSPHALARRELNQVTSATALPVELASGDGLVVWFQPEP